MATKQSEPIAIVGSGCRFPGGAHSPSALWKLLESPRDLCQDIPKDRFDTTSFYHANGSHHGTTNVRRSYFMDEDVRLFDAAFFNISPNEADSMDPQQRLLLETVYEALEAGGHTLEGMRGSDTAVYVGTMTADYNDTLTRDLNVVPTYFATGTNRAIISNRVSYFFDWHGPSLTLDTACSSSLIAVHLGVKSLRGGESRIAVACGTQVILNPEMFIGESKMKMLSPTSRSRMWDADADGYARGEGLAAVVLKRLSDAIADGDHIECIIRETGTNQDGFSNGITVPSTEAQAALIRQTYARAGLDPENNPRDRPQYFEAHGTGTQAGDPKEAAAIHQSLGRHITNDPLYVGSIKTVIGHLEGAAGLAGVLKGSAMIQEGFIAPNLLFNNLNPKIEPYYQGLKVPTRLTPWPKLPEGVPRRVSVNSFGFGGSNAHAILEQFSAEGLDRDIPERVPLTPFIFSALSEASLVAQLQAYSKHLKTCTNVNASDLAWTLQTRRSPLAFKAAFSATSIQQLASKIDAKLETLKQSAGASIGIRSVSSRATAATRILGVFTGQGAQWAAMGAQLIRSSEFVRKRVQELEDSLTDLPPSDRPQWRLVDEMLAAADASRIAEAELSQPLCTVLQIVLVDLLGTAGITFSAVVGHSSGEIGAAYAAGFLSASDAVRVAYYRGFHAKLAGNIENGQKGAMLAVGTSWEDAQDLISLQAFKGRLAVAAHNSPASVTLSGDADAVIHAKKVFDEEKKFARFLKVDTAYHSHHMLPCGEAYVQSLRACGVRSVRDPSKAACSWFSSVVPSEEAMDAHEGLADVYWRDNMTNTVLFADAVRNAIARDDQLGLVIEVGPHPALKGPATQIISDLRPASLPYCGVLNRGANDVEAFSDALGLVWAHLDSRAVDFQSFEKAVACDPRQPKLVTGLPSYQWNHTRSYWSESRKSRKARGRKQPPHEVLGSLSPDSNSHDMRWANVLKPSEIPWLDGHQLQGQRVFPAAGYVSMALEASRSLAAERPVELFELHDLAIPRAITFDDADDSGVETLVTLTAIENHKDQTSTADFSCYSIPVVGTGSAHDMDLMASGTVRIVFGTPSVAALTCRPLEEYNMTAVDTEQFYSGLSDLGYGYAGPFKAMSSMKRKLNHSSVLVDSYSYTDDEDSVHMVHPSMLDVAFQSAMLAYSAPGDDRLWSLHVPTSIRSIRVNPALCASLPLSGTQVPAYTVIDGETQAFCASIDIFSEDGQRDMVQVEDLVLKPFAPATETDDRRLYTYMKLDLAVPDPAPVVQDARPSADEIELATVCERMSLYYVRRWKSEISEEEWENCKERLPHLQNWVDRTLSAASRGQNTKLRREWAEDSPEEIEALISKYPESIDVKVLAAIGRNLPAVLRGEASIREHVTLDDYYEHGLGFQRYHVFLAKVIEQIVHRYPHSRILEIGAGAGGATQAVLESIGTAFSSYTYTNITDDLFKEASRSFKPHSDKMTFKVLDIEKAATSQGYEAHSYDIVIASNSLRPTASLRTTLANTRQLLKPGGYLVLLEITNQEPIRLANTLLLGDDHGRKHSSHVTPGEWHSALRHAGFSGVDSITPEINGSVWPLSIMVSQAVDDRVQFLRRPLAVSAKSSLSVHLESLVILGNQSLDSARISEELAEHLGHFCGELTILDGLPSEEEALNLAPMSTFINLVDIDSPIFEDITTEKMDGLKRVFELAKHVLWITQDAMVDQPYHMASIAFSRTVRNEAGHISLNHLDVSDLHGSVSKSIAEHVLRQSALDEWEATTSGDRHQYQKLLWSKEPETFLDHGRLKVPRLLSNVGQNARLNSSKRDITATVPISGSNVSVSLSADLQPSVVKNVLPIARDGHGSNLIGVESSSLLALQVVADTFLFLAIGKDKSKEGDVVLLSTTNSREVAPVASITAPVVINNNTQSTDALLVAVASELLAKPLVQSLPSGCLLLVHSSGKNRFLAAALSRQAAAKGVRLTFTCDSDSADSTQDPEWVTLDARAPQHVLRRTLLRTRPTHFLDTTSRSQSSGLSFRIAQALPSGCKKIDPSTLYQHQSSLPTSCDRDALARLLEDAVSSARASADSIAQEHVQDLVIQLEQLHGMSVVHHTNSVVHWPLDGTVKVHVRPLDDRMLFSKDKTYLLVGLSGSLGRSLCEWMVANGAGCVCLTSRRPKVDEKWIQSFQGTEANVKVIAMDVTNRSSVESVVRDIRASCPPIAGVANGAMVLNDALFSNMSAEAMLEGLRPKIDGSNNLDQVFYDDELDFFIGFSSSSGVVGNPGQSNYAAANGYINGLVRQRRRRGLAASAFDIGRVAGVGVLQTADQAVVEQLTNFGLTAISEPDLRHMFAETILAGYPDPSDRDDIPAAVLTTGIRTFRDDEEVTGPWFSNPIFSHCVVDSGGAESGPEGQEEKSRLPVGQQLAGAATKEQALEVLKDCFAAKLRLILQLSDQDLDPDAPLVELGIDSLVAVGVRSWFLKELKVDIPVLKVVGGASIAELCQTALEKLPEGLLSGIGKEGVEVPRPAVKQPQPQVKAVSQLLRVAESGLIPASGHSSVVETPLFDRDRSPFASSTNTTPSSPRSELDIPKASGKPDTTPVPPLTLTAERPARRFLKSEPISLGQSRFWFLRLLLEDQRTSNVAFYYHITGDLRVGDLERAIRIVTTRHEALRTCFVEDHTDAGQAYQKVLPSSPVRLERKKISSEDDIAAEYTRLKEHDFDLASGDLLKLVLLSLSSSSHYLLVNYPHILMDGVSFQVFLSDLEKAYNGQTLGAPPRQYPEFSVSQRRAYEAGEMGDELKYWQGIFPAGEQPPILPLLPMAQTSSRVAMKTFGTHQVVCHLEPALAARIKEASKVQRSTPFHFYLATFKAMLFCFTDAQDLTIGIADAGRNDRDLMGSIGFFLNLLTLRFRRQTDQPFSEAIAEARDTAYAALGNSRLPFDVLLAELNVARSSAHSPFFQAFLDYRQGAQEKHPWGNTQFEFQDMHPGRTAYDITLDITDSATDALVMLRAQKSLYDATAAGLLLETYVHLLDVLSSDPSLPLKSTPLFGEKQLSNATKIGRGPTLVSNWPGTLPHRIDQIASEFGDKVALKDGDGGSLTYSDMTNRIEAIAESLQKVGAGPGSRVLVFQHATADWVCSMLAIMRIGGIYVPLDLRNPMPRLAAVAKDCEPAAVLVHASTLDDAPQLDVPQAGIIDVSSLPHKASSRIANRARADSPAAILYTSGSTGTPKGIMVTHAGLRNEIEGYTKTWKLGAERVLQQSAFTFNHSSDQMYTGLVNGGMVYIVPTRQRGDPLEITKILQEQSITYTKATPSEYSLWIQYGGDNLQRASEWCFAFGGGEPLTSTITQEFAGLGLAHLRFFNSYGPTETSISSHKMEIGYRQKEALEAMGRIPCGYSLPNYHTYIVDEQLRPLPVGMPGEVCIGGAGVSLGYLNNSELTDKQFVPNPFSSPGDMAQGWTRMYRTNDIGHLQEDGAMVFHNRIAGDTQVKIRGLRIELSDIESNIVTASGGALKEAVVTLRDELLVAHVVFAPQHEVRDNEAFLDQLLSQLPIPQYMIPVVAIPLDKLPLTNHSKVDRNAIRDMPLPERAAGSHGHDHAELTETMVQLRGVWRDVLDKAGEKLGLEINPTTSFFLVGGNSLLAIRLQSRIRQAFNVTIRLVELLDANTLGDMARRIEESTSIGAIDWEQETAPPSLPNFLETNLTTARPLAGGQEKPRTVLLTGATGFLAKHLLPRLAASPGVGTIHCVAVRDRPGEGPRAPAHPSPKIVTHSGDLSKPLLGLSEGEFLALAGEVDVILHMGAVRSFWDNYHVLRPGNVHPTRELVRLAAPRRVPIHYISTVGVLPREEAEASAAAGASAAAHVPPADGTDGYVASRWASERILERSGESLGVPSTVYRFLPAPDKDRPAPQEVLDELVRLVDVSGLVPELGGWSGRTDMIPAGEAAQWLLESVLAQQQADGSSPENPTRFVHHRSPISVDGAELETYIQQQRGGRGLDKIPVLRWFGRIKALGFNYFLAAQDATVESGEGGQGGAKFASRR